jgi:hypothetical protein
MRPDFADSTLEELYYDRAFMADFDPEVVEDYRDCLQVIVASPNPSVLAEFRDVEPLSAGSERHAIALKGRCRLIVKFHQAEEPSTLIEAIETSRGDR